MKRTIWKYELTVAEYQTVEMPVDAEILTVQMQGDVLCLWALVSPDAELAPRSIEVFGTGHPIEYSAGNYRRYIGTVQMHGGSLVWHVFEYTGI